jgi:hypothetical protein
LFPCNGPGPVVWWSINTLPTLFQGWGFLNSTWYQSLPASLSLPAVGCLSLPHSHRLPLPYPRRSAGRRPLSRSPAPRPAARPRRPQERRAASCHRRCQGPASPPPRRPCSDPPTTCRAAPIADLPSARPPPAARHGLGVDEPGHLSYAVVAAHNPLGGVAPAPAHSAVAVAAAAAAVATTAVGLGLPGYLTCTGALTLVVDSAAPSPNRVPRPPPLAFNPVAHRSPSSLGLPGRPLPTPRWPLPSPPSKTLWPHLISVNVLCPSLGSRNRLWGRP